MAAERDPGFAARLRGLRAAAGLTQYALGIKSGIRADTIARLEQGKAGPTWATVTALAGALGVPVGAFAEPPRTKPAKRGRGRPKPPPV
jgi:transcriptional regulator with XRE-family HTH domain